MTSVLDESTIRLLLTRYGDAAVDSMILPRCPPIVVYCGVIALTGDSLFAQPDNARIAGRITNEYLILNMYSSSSTEINDPLPATEIPCCSQHFICGRPFPPNGPELSCVQSYRLSSRCEIIDGWFHLSRRDPLKRPFGACRTFFPKTLRFYEGSGCSGCRTEFDDWPHIYFLVSFTLANG